MTHPELSLLLHRLREMADEHEVAADEEYYAHTAEAHTVTAAREGFLCGPLLREAAAEIDRLRAALNAGSVEGKEAW